MHSLIVKSFLANDDTKMVPSIELGLYKEGYAT